MAMTRPGKRLYLTADKGRLVPEGHPSAAFLYCTAEDEVDAAEYARLSGLAAPGLEVPTKALQKPADKARRRGGDK